MHAGNIIKCCKECDKSLRAKKVPDASLVRFDIGPYPEQLEPLTWIEEMIVSVLRPCHHIIFVKPVGSQPWRPNDTFTRAMRGHVVAFPNPAPEELSRIFPLSLEEVPDMLSVVLLAPAQSQEQAERMAKKVKILQVSPSIKNEYG
jgi:hypothetical protein